MMMCGLYTYWAHSKDVEAPAGISVTAIERQFGRLPTWHAEGSLTTDFPCPTCGQVAQLHAAPSIKNRGVLLLQCAACGHQTERTIWDERETYQKLKCTCEACMTTVAKTAESVAPLARRLGANLATFCSDSATREIARMQALPVTADKRRTPAGVSAQAMLGRTDSPYDTCLAIFNQGWIHPIDFIERMSALLDELIGARAIGFQTQWMCDPNDPAAVLEYVVTNRLVMPDPQQRVSAALTKVLSGYTVADNASFTAWVGALDDLCLLTHYFPLPVGFAYFEQDDQGSSEEFDEDEWGIDGVAEVPGFINVTILVDNDIQVDRRLVSLRYDQVIELTPVGPEFGYTEITLDQPADTINRTCAPPVLLRRLRKVVVAESFKEVQDAMLAAHESLRDE